jgi:hypothetical protein
VGTYLIRRFFLMLLTLFGISVLIFTMLRLVPGNIADIVFNAAGMIDVAEKAKLEKELGLDRPIPVQYVEWVGGLARGDLGYSYVSEKPAIDEILPRIPITAKLAGLALLFAVTFGVPLGVISAVKQNTTLDYVLRVVSLSGLSLPSFWLGLLILMAFVAYFGALPIYTDPPKGFWNTLWLFQYSGGGGRLPLVRPDHAADALLDAGGPSPGLHPHRTGQGRSRPHGQLPPRVAQRAAAGRDRNRHRGCLPDGRADRDGNRVQRSRRGALSCGSDPLARLPNCAEPRDVHRGGGGIDQFPDRPTIRGARSAHPLRELAACRSWTSP